MNIVDAIDKKIGEVRTESLDMSVGEIIALHQQNELIIQPDFQRLFRWSPQQQSRLVESLLLELPIPSIFLIEKETGVLELIDGLQRISSLLHFIDANSLKTPPVEDEQREGNDASFNRESSQLDEDAIEVESDKPSPLRLEGCDLVKELNGLIFEELPLTLRLRLKRTPIRTVIIKRQSSQFLRYEMFKRLNTGGSKLSDQDIRNVNARMLGDSGAAFYKRLAECARYPAFVTTIELLSSTSRDTRADEELVLRFFASAFYREEFRGNVGDWLDAYMEAVLIKHYPFGDAEVAQFKAVFDALADKFGPYAFVKYRNGEPVGGVAPAYFEAVTNGALADLTRLQTLNSQRAKSALASAVESAEFRKVTGPGANSLPKLVRRIQIVARAFAAA
ncbi:MAG TPA: DUF262 domain-containing protein [Casimicrobium sp.]|nr:DUF262 domain-containing protein [Casimicrobium sp.]